jgi:hypothetical protein
VERELRGFLEGGINPDSPDNFCENQQNDAGTTREWSLHYLIRVGTASRPVPMYVVSQSGRLEPA